MNPSSDVQGLYRRQGFAPLGAMLGQDEVQHLRQALLEGLGEVPDRSAYGVLRHNLWRRLPAFRELLLEGRLARAAARVLGAPELVFFQDNLVWKPPGTMDRVQWHQDHAYWPLDRPAGVTLWLALDDTDPGNGCLHYLPGTHLLGERCPTDFVPGSRQPLRPDLPPLDWEGRERDAVAVPLQAGEAVAHHPLLWHMSPPNPGPRQRRAWSLTFLLPETRWSPAHAPHPCVLELHPGEGDPVEGGRFPRFYA